MINKQKQFYEIKNELRGSATRLYNMPDYAQVDLNLVNMANYFPLIQDIIDSFSPKVISEIGSDQGVTANLLYQYCKEKKTKLHIVDPVLQGIKISDDIVSVYQEKSISYLNREAPADIYFIDGDHNFYTVINELRIINKKNISNKPRLIFIHDVGWPCGYRDMYYDKTNIDDKFQQKTNTNINLSVYKSKYCDDKKGLPINEVSIAVTDDGVENGVLSAVEKFLEESKGWQYFSIPSIFGLGILWYGNGAKEETVKKIHFLSNEFKRNNSFLSILEFNRILLLEKIQELYEEIHENGQLWKKQQDFIQYQSNQIIEQKKLISELKENLMQQKR